MSENAGSIIYTVDIATGRLVRGVRDADGVIRDLDRSMDNANDNAGTLSGTLSKLATAIGAVIAAGALRDMAGLVQKFQEMSERVQMATSSQVEFEMVQRRLMETANGTYRSLEEAQELYIRTADSLRSMGYSTQQALDVTDSMSYAFVTNAASADRANAAISALSKSVNTGKVAADQWETITSAIPSVIDDIADAAGKSSAEIRALGAAGKLTGAQLTEGLRKSLDANAEAAGKMAANLTDASVRTKTALTVMLVSLEEQTGALQALTDGIVEAANFMLEFGGDTEKMSNFLNTATTAATALGAVIVGRVVTSLASAVAGQVAMIAATLQNIQVQRVAASVALQSAEAEMIRARAKTAAAAATLQASTTAVQHAIALRGLTAAQIAETAAVNAYTAAQLRANTVAGTATLVMGGLRSAMAFLGGPLGVVLLAATALYTFGGSARDAKPPTDDLTKSVQELTAAQRELAIEQAKNKIPELVEDIAKYNYHLREANKLSEKGATKGPLFAAQAKVQIEEAEKSLEAYQKRLADLQNFKPGSAGSSPASAPAPEPEPTLIQSPAASDKATKAASALANKIRDQVAELQFQADTLGMTSSELEIYKLQLANATDEQIRAAQSSLSLIDAYKMQADAEAEIQKRRESFGDTSTEVTATVTGQVAPLSGGAFDDQTARYEAEAEAERVRYADQLARLQEAKELELEVIGGYQAKEQEFAQTHADRLAQIEAAKNQTMLAAGQQTFDALASATAQFAGEQSGLYKVMFAASKAFAIAQSLVAIQQGIAMAAANPWPVNLAAMASVAAATASIVGNIGSVAMSGRALGGPVQADNMYRVNETGAPEIFNAANGRQYMMPNQRGEVVSNKDATGNGGGTKVEINIQNHTGQKVTQSETQMDDKRVIDIIVGDIMGDGKTSKAIQRTTGMGRVGA